MKHIKPFINPKRKKLYNNYFKNIIIKFGVKLGFTHLDYSSIHGGGELTCGERVSTVNTIFNTNGGNITIGDDVIFGHNCLLLTGTHRFINGKRASLTGVSFGSYPESPTSGRDIYIDDGCFIGSGAVLIGPLHIGTGSIICASSVVTKSFPPYSVLAGVPAKKIGTTLELGKGFSE